MSDHTEIPLACNMNAIPAAERLAVGIDRLTPRVEDGWPVTALECTLGGVPASYPNLAALIVEQIDAGDHLRVSSCRGPGFISIGVTLRGALARGRRTDLEVGHRAEDLPVERFVELQCGVSEMRLHPLALGLADLSDPSVLEQRQRGKEHHQGGGEDGERGRSWDLHEAKSST